MRFPQTDLSQVFVLSRCSRVRSTACHTAVTAAPATPCREEEDQDETPARIVAWIVFMKVGGSIGFLSVCTEQAVFSTCGANMQCQSGLGLLLDVVFQLFLAGLDAASSI